MVHDKALKERQRQGKAHIGNKVAQRQIGK
jgi:hypothetical protein